MAPKSCFRKKIILLKAKNCISYFSNAKNAKRTHEERVSGMKKIAKAHTFGGLQMLGTLEDQFF